ncbi:hypothetical protein DWX22_03335 [Coprococcus sp. AF18-48]|nr:hypothetical protein DWX22_03335 [Coprococcus sp. AF18-48]
MVEVNILFSTNCCERMDLKIEDGAIQEFTQDAYADGTYRAVVSFECMSRCFNPDIMQIIIDLKDIGDCVLAWGSICMGIIKFSRKVHGYAKSIMIRKTEEKYIVIRMTENMTEEELESEIKSKLSQESETEEKIN